MKTWISLIVLILCLNVVKVTASDELYVPLKGRLKDKRGIKRECWGKIDSFLQRFADYYDQALVVTEAMDTINRTNHSFHKIPCGARDVRVWNLSKKMRKLLVTRAKEEHFFAINEGNHIHIDIGGMKSKEDRLKILEKANGNR